MSGGTVCKCEESKKPIKERDWTITAYKCNYSAFSGYDYTPSAYSEIRCNKCSSRWRTKADYVLTLKTSGKNYKS